jgi:hypothetical protein
VDQHGPAAYTVQNLGQRGFHPRAFAGGQDHDVQRFVHFLGQPSLAADFSFTGLRQYSRIPFMALFVLGSHVRAGAEDEWG